MERGSRKSAIEGVRDLLLVLLQDEKWCQAEGVGKALKLLVEGANPVTAAPGTACEEISTISAERR